ncbi:MAG: inositol monophosphatase [Anaerolineae bacterium]|nr:MAG: inositol monophosphatase [Anaerolineae bacterium]
MIPHLGDVVRLARGAGEILREAFGKPRSVTHKGAIDLVTEADLAVESYLLDIVRREWPEDRVFAEEAGLLPGNNSEVCWYIDPLDGTTNFAHQLPQFSVSIAFADAEGLRLAAVYDPMRDEIFSAERGRGAFLNDLRIRVSGATTLLESLLVTGFPYDRGTNPDNNLNYFNHLVPKCQGIRRLGSAALDLVYVAAGRVDAFWELRLQPWDAAAGTLIAREAGALVTRMDGQPDVLRPPCSILAANPALHTILLAEISAAPKIETRTTGNSSPA